MPDRIDAVSWLQGERNPDAVMIVLNQPITRRDLFDLAWKSSSHVVVTDGAANQLRALNNNEYLPDFVVGDFDSVTAETRAFYESKHVPFISEPSQYATDFMKAMNQSNKKFPVLPGKTRLFVAFGALGGRVDHSWHSYLCLSIAHNKGDRLVLVSDQSLTFLVPTGDHLIPTPRDKVGITCGYAPLEGDATVTTKGFEWDVEDYYVSFTTKLSTSNHVKADELFIHTDKPLMFTVELKQPNQQAVSL